MGRVTLTLPRLGETMEEARVTDWLVAPGTAFKRGDVLLEVETDKTVVEVPALTDGTLIEQLVTGGEMVALDQPIALVEAEGAAQAPEPEPATPAPASAPHVAPAAPTVATAPHTTAEPIAASPAARAAARRNGADLSLVTGTGRRGRITAADITGNAPSGDIALHRAGGGGTPIILLHGLFDTHKGWRDLPRRLAAAGHTVLAADLPGHGDSAPAASFDDAARQLAQAITAAIPAGPLRLIGHSLGAALAVKLATLMPARVERLILSAPAGLGPRINADFTQGMLAAETPDALARALSLLDAGPLSASALAQELARVKSGRAAQSALAAALSSQGFQQLDITADLARLTCAVSVIFGTADRILDWHAIEHLPAAAAIHLIRGAGHLPHHAAGDLLLALAADPAERSAALLP